MSTMMNTLFVTTSGAYVRKDHETIVVEVERKRVLAVPFHHLAGVMCFGPVTVSPFLMGACAERGIALSFLTERGRFLARVEGKESGNVLLRRTQYRRADIEGDRVALARGFVMGKLANSRALLQRGARETADEAVSQRLKRAIREIGRRLEQALTVDTMDGLRGLEGDAAANYFGVLDGMIKRHQDCFNLKRRTRRPPLDPLNALLSFLYTLLLHDCASALQAVGLDAAVGYLHVDRPGRLSLACDLMEELRSAVADRLAVSMINRGQVKPEGFEHTASGAVNMDRDTRKAVLSAYQNRKKEVLQHPFLEREVPLGMVVHVQARLLARVIRGELDAYPPYVIR